MRQLTGLQRLFVSGLVKAPQLILLALRTSDSSGMRAAEASDATGVNSVLLSMGVTSLVRQGLVERRYPYRDGRGVTLYLTEKGRARADVMHLALVGFSIPT